MKNTKIDLAKVSSGFYKEFDGVYIPMADVRKIVDILEKSPDFHELIKKLREKYNISTNWHYSTKKMEDLFLECYGPKKWESKLGEYIDDCKLLLIKLKIPVTWCESIAWYGVYNYLSPLCLSEIAPYPGNQFKLKEPAIEEDENNLCEGTIHIVVDQKYSRKQFDSKIDEIWGEIEFMMEALPSIPNHKRRRVKLAKEVTILRDEEKFTFKKIAEILSEKYDEDEELYSLLTEDYVKNLYARWRKLHGLSNNIIIG